MPIRNPQEKGLRRTWVRRHGVDEFPQAGGIDKEGNTGDVSPQDFRHLENVRWRDPSIVSRGGQTALLGPGQLLDGCILGLAEVSEALAIFVGSRIDSTFNTPDSEHLDRYYPDTSPQYLDPTIATGQPLPQKIQVWDRLGLEPLFPRRCLLAFDGRLLMYAETDAALTPVHKVYQVSLPSRDTPVADFAAATKADALFEIAEMSSWVYKFERDVDPNHATFGAQIPVLYMGTVTTGEVWRWDGSNLALDTPAPLSGTGRIILSTWLGDIVACRTDGVTCRNFGPWDRVIPIVGAGTFIPTCGAEYAGLVYFGGRATGQGGIIFFDPSANEMAFRAPIPPDLGATVQIVSDMCVHNELLHYGWTEAAGVSNPGFIGTVDALGNWTDNVYLFPAEDGGWIGAMLSNGGDLFFTIMTNLDGLSDGTELRSLNLGLIHEYGENVPFPADLVAL